MRTTIRAAALLALVATSAPASALGCREGGGPMARGAMRAMGGMRAGMRAGLSGYPANLGGIYGYPVNYGAGLYGYPLGGAGLHSMAAASARFNNVRPLRSAGVRSRASGAPAGPAVAAAQEIPRRGAFQEAAAPAPDVRAAADAAARSLQELSATRPVRSGTVVRVQGGRIEVSYEEGAEEVTASFPAREVFYFRASGELTSAFLTPGELTVGDRVLVPEPASAQISPRR